MSRVLTAPAVAAPARALGIPAPALDARTRELLEAAAADAYERGVADGRAAGAASARAEAQRAAAAVVAALEATAAEARALQAAVADGDVRLASAIAEAVLGRTPHDGGAALLERVHEALSLLDDRPLVVRANPADVDLLADGLRAVGGLSVEPDAALAPGEARVVGQWGSAQLTRAAAWERLREVLDDAAAAADAEDGRG